MSLLSTATSALLTYERALATTGHNISNATTEGYSRQRPELEARNAQLIGHGYIGQGVQVATITRVQSEYVDAQLRDSVSDAANGSVRAEYAERIDRLLGATDTGMAPALQGFFDAANDVSSDPVSSTNRTVFLTQADSLARRFNELNTRVEEQRDLINEQLKSDVEEVNELAGALRDLNNRIVAGYGAAGGTGAAPNDLLDERGRVLGQLAEKIEIRTLEQEDHAMNVFIGNGQPLVLGDQVNTLAVANVQGDMNNYGIGFAGPDGVATDITKFMTGGEIGGLLEIRKEVLDPAQNGIGQIAAVLSVAMNQQNGLGLDLNGDIGEPIFAVPSVGVGALPGNASSDYPAVALNTDEIDQLTTADYSLRYNAENPLDPKYELRRLDTNALVATITPGDTAKVDGLEIDTSGMAGMANNDSWQIQPTRSAAEQIELTMADPDKIAAAAGALAADENTGSAELTALRSLIDDSNTSAPAAVVFDGTDFVAYSPEYGALNSGTATIEGFTVTDSAATTGNPSDAISYSTAVGGFMVDGLTEPVVLDPSGTTTIAANGWEVKIRGTPADGDSFDVTSTTTALAGSQPATTTVARSIDGMNNNWELDLYGEPNTGDVFTVELRKGREGDNRNMLELAGLAERRIIEESETFSDGYNDTLGLVGTRTSQAQVFRDSSQALLQEAQSQRDEISGVNLDEEAANLIKYQKAYQAAAQVIAVGSQIFDTLFAALR